MLPGNWWCCCRIYKGSSSRRGFFVACAVCRRRLLQRDALHNIVSQAFPIKIQIFRMPPRVSSVLVVAVVALRRVRSLSCHCARPGSPAAFKTTHKIRKDASNTYHQQVRILKPLSRCKSGVRGSRCTDAVKSGKACVTSAALCTDHDAKCERADGTWEGFSHYLTLVLWDEILLRLTINSLVLGMYSCMSALAAPDDVRLAAATACILSGATSQLSLSINSNPHS
jgi:hypothetical protein